MPKDNQKPLHRIHEYMTKTTWLHAEDALHFSRDDTDAPIPKIRLFAGLYNRGKGANLQLVHWLDAADARVIFADLSWGKTVKFTDYKGSNGAEPESRVLRINTKEDKVYFQLSRGPGKPTTTGAIMPNGPATDSVNVGMTINEARKMAYAVLEHMTAYAVSKLVAKAVPRPAEIATTPRKLTDEEASTIADDLFGVGSDRLHSKKVATGQTHNGRTVMGTPITLPIAPTKIDGTAVYQNGEPIKPEDDSMVREYQSAHRNELPFSRSVLTGWFYR